MERTWPLVDPGAGSQQSQAPHPFPCAVLYVVPTIPIVGTVWKNSALLSNALWTVQVTEPCYSNKRVQGSSHLEAPNYQLVSPLLMKLQLPHLEGPPLSCISPGSLFWGEGSFRFPWELPSWGTNKDKTTQKCCWIVGLFMAVKRKQRISRPHRLFRIGAKF